MNESTLPYFRDAARLLAYHYRIVLFPLAVGLVSNLMSSAPSRVTHTLSIFSSLSLLAIIPVLYGRINEIITDQEFKSWKHLFSKYFVKYLGYLLFAFVVMSLPLFIFLMAGQFLGLSLGVYLIFISIAYHLLALYAVPLLFYEEGIKNSFVLGYKCLAGNFKFNIPLIMISVALILVSRPFTLDEMGAAGAAINFLRWCVWVLLQILLFTAVSFILKAKLYGNRNQEAERHDGMDRINSQ
jgi:hypothetical protein